MTRSHLFTAIAVVLVFGSAVLGQTPNHRRTFKGTYTCIACDLQKTTGARAQCDIFGHDYGVRLSNGTYIHLLANDHAADLLKDGGRTDFAITVTGAYDRSAHVIDVEKYSIDGIETTWSERDHRMEMAPNHIQLASKREHDTKLTER